MVRHALPAGEGGVHGGERDEASPGNPCRFHQVLVLFDEVGLVREREAGDDGAIEFGFIERLQQLPGHGHLCRGIAVHLPESTVALGDLFAPEQLPGGEEVRVRIHPGHGLHANTGVGRKGFPLSMRPAPA
ncbi:MAG: hypothetical protein IPI85_08520 [Dehalococcoidia bacterium]|nr:hypothetical protein [Dehalococcoidia bacterium]